MRLRWSDQIAVLAGVFIAPASTLLFLFFVGFISLHTRQPPSPPDTAAEFTQQGMRQTHLGHPSEALPDFERALKLDASFAPAVQGKAMALWQLGQQSTAIQSFEQAIQLYRAQEDSITALYLEKEVKRLRSGESLPCLHYSINGRLLCAPM